MNETEFIDLQEKETTKEIIKEMTIFIKIILYTSLSMLCFLLLIIFI